MANMTLHDLRVSLQNFMPVWVDIDKDDNDEIIIYTRLREDENGELVPIEEEEDTE